MKYFFIRWFSVSVAAAAIIMGQEYLPGWIWGVSVSVVLIAFALIWQIVTSYETQAKDELEYQEWVKNMDARNHQWNEEV